MNTVNRLVSPLRPALFALCCLAISPLSFAASHQASANEPALAAPAQASSVTTSQSVDGLAPGQFEWHPERSPVGQMVLVVSLPEQRLHVYRNGVRIGISTISTGKPGKETPTGVFEILQKEKMHRSNLYDDAKMPFMQRLTWDGIALHSGRLPGYPASHGCVRLPNAFAQMLYAETERGTKVVIADALSNSAAVISPGDRAPVDTYSGLELETQQTADQLAPDVGTPGTVVSDDSVTATY